LYSRRLFLLISLAYDDKVIESGFSKASEINRNNLLEYKEKKINKRIPLVLTLSNIIPSLFRENFRYEWLDTFSYVLPPADVTVKEVNHVRCFAIDIAKDLLLLSCWLIGKKLKKVKRWPSCFLNNPL
jgi:hypothetical protein